MTTHFPVTYGSSDILAINKLINVGGTPKRALTFDEEVQALQEKNPEAPPAQIQQAVVAARRNRGDD